MEARRSWQEGGEALSLHWSYEEGKGALVCGGAGGQGKEENLPHPAITSNSPASHYVQHTVCIQRRSHDHTKKIDITHGQTHTRPPFWWPLQDCFVLADPNLADMPIVYASPAFLRMTGYSCTEVLGRNCRFLQVRFPPPEKYFGFCE